MSKSITPEQWKEVNPKDEAQVDMCLKEVAKQRDHYATRSIKDLANYITGKISTTDFIYESDDFSISVLLYCKDKTKMTNNRTACIGHAWYKGNIEWSDAMESILNKAKAYAKDNGCTQIFHVQPKDMKDDGPCCDFKFTKPYAENKNYIRLQEHFRNIQIEENNKNIYILVTI